MGPETDQTRRLQVTEYFRARLAEEGRRCERYHRPFAVVFVSCPQTDPRDIFNYLRPFLRCTDIVEIIRSRPRLPRPAPGAPPRQPALGENALRDRVAMILPETGRDGAERTLQRLQAQCTKLGDMRLGCAVFPDDSRNPPELLGKAAAAAGEAFHV